MTVAGAHEVQVLLDPQFLASFSLTPEDIRQRLTEENLNVPGGTLKEGRAEYMVRTLNEYVSLDEIAAERAYMAARGVLRESTGEYVDDLVRPNPDDPTPATHAPGLPIRTIPRLRPPIAGAFSSR